MNLQYLPDHWKKWLIKRALKLSNGQFETLGADAFPSDHAVELLFPDGSSAIFSYSFYSIDEDRCEIAVFTEHCGYHIFPAHNLNVKLVKLTC
jgi:hypothetical protein